MFPENPLANFRAKHSSKVKHVLGAASPESLTLSELLSFASESELQQWHDLKLDYSPAAGEPELREQIAHYYNSGKYSGLDCRDLSAEHVVTFAGAQEAIFAVYHALLKTGDIMQAISPHFAPLHLVAEGCGAQINVQALDFDSQGCWSLNVDQWCQTFASNKTTLAAINFPHNPTGAMITANQLEQMVAICEQQGCWLFSDEVFRGLEYNEGHRLPPVASLYENGISLGVLSKSHGLGGVRVGWIACRNKLLIRRLLEIKEYLSICNGQPDELLARITLRSSARILETNRRRAQQNLAILEENRVALPHLKWSSPKAGILLYPQLKGAESSDEFVSNMLNKTGALVLPGHCFGLGANHIRIGYGREAFNWQALRA